MRASSFVRSSSFALLASSSLTLLACSSSKTNGATEDSGVDGNAADTFVAPTGPVCTVTATGTSGVAISGTVLMTSGPTVGEIFIGGDGKIACVSAGCSATTGYAAATQIACPGGVISPGLIDAHDHTDYNHAAPIPTGTTRWDHRNGWRTGTGGEPTLNTPSYTDDVTTLTGAELRFAMSGVTALVGSGGVQGLVRNLASYQNLPWLEGATEKVTFFDTFPLGDSNGTELTSGCAYPKVRAASTAFEDGIYAPHVAEGINAAAENEFTCEDGSLALITNRTSIIHGVGLNGCDVAKVAAAGANLIWSPRSNLDLYGDTAPVTEYKAAGVTIAMGTDWILSGSMNMLRELQCADSLNGKYFHNAFSDQELFEMATKNSAIAAGFSGELGTLEVGKLGDVVVFDGRVDTGYRAVINASDENISLVLRGGKALYGDAPLTTALMTAGSATACGDIEVCTQSKQVCIDTTGITLAAVQTNIAGIYPLFFCKGDTITAEPTCTPYRDAYPNGTSATDRDGDGVPDTTDNCPDVFNPPREMDGTTQADVDGDGIGDACDPNEADGPKKCP